MPAYQFESISNRIERLRAQIPLDPSQRENIEAIIQYYENGGPAPTPGQIVYAYGNGAKLATLKEFDDDLKMNGQGRLPYCDITAYQLSHVPTTGSTGGSPIGHTQVGGEPPQIPLVVEQMAESATIGRAPGDHMHQVRDQHSLP